MSNEIVLDTKPEETQENLSLVDLFDERLTKLENMIMRDRLNRLELDYNNAMNCRNRGFVCPKVEDKESSESEESDDDENYDNKLAEAIKKLEENKKLYSKSLDNNANTYKNHEIELTERYNDSLIKIVNEYNKEIEKRNNEIKNLSLLREQDAKQIACIKLVNDKCMNKINDLKNEIILVRELNAKLILNDKQKQFEKIERFEYIKNHLKLLLNKDFYNLIKLEEYLLDINNKSELQKIFQKNKNNYYKYYNQLRIKRNNICHPEL